MTSKKDNFNPDEPGIIAHSQVQVPRRAKASHQPTGEKQTFPFLTQEFASILASWQVKNLGYVSISHPTHFVLSNVPTTLYVYNMKRYGLQAQELDALFAKAD